MFLIIKPVNKITNKKMGEKNHLTKTKKRLVNPDQGSFVLHVTEKLQDSIIMQTCSQTYHIPSFTQMFTDHVTLFESFDFSL